MYMYIYIHVHIPIPVTLLSVPLNKFLRNLRNGAALSYATSPRCKTNYSLNLSTQPLIHTLVGLNLIIICIKSTECNGTERSWTIVLYS